MSKISVALCTYNGAKFLAGQLESFLWQTRLPDELVVCDDGSADETLEILQNFAATAPFPVKILVNEKNLGSTKNFEKAISLCTGDLIFLSDQDDVWKAEKLAEFEKEFERKPNAALIFSDAELVDKNLQPLGINLFDITFPEEKRGEEIFNVLLGQNAVTGAAMAFRAEFRQNFMPIPASIPNLIHDGWIALALAALPVEIAFIDAPLIKYRQHAAQQMGVDFESATAENFAERRKSFAETVRFLQKTTEMLEHLREIPQLENKRETFVKIIKKNRAQIKHLEARADLPQARFGRILPVFKEILSGRYQKFSRGFLSAGKDLLER